MRSLLDKLGLKMPVADSEDTQTVRRIASELDRLDAREARFLAAFAYVLARVAQADFEVSPEEVAAMEDIVQRFGGLSEAQAALVVQIAKSQAIHLGGTEDYLVTRQFKELSNKDERISLVRCLFAVAAADQSISEVENSKISQIANELGLLGSEVAAVRTSFREHLEVLKGSE